MPVNWNTVGPLVRLLVCMYPDHKFDYKKIAKRWTEFYGEAVSYHSIEGFFRKIRKEVKDMEERGASFSHAGTLDIEPAVATVPQVRQRTPKKTSKPRCHDDVIHGRRAHGVQKTRRSPCRSTQRSAVTIKVEDRLAGASALTPSSMSAASDAVDPMSITKDFAVFDFGTPTAPSFETPDVQYDMRGFDDEDI